MDGHAEIKPLTSDRTYMRLLLNRLPVLSCVVDRDEGPKYFRLAGSNRKLISPWRHKCSCNHAGTVYA